MKRVISYNNAIIFSIVLIGLLIIMHLSILIGIVLFNYAPLDIIWGGKLETVDQLLKYELVSLITSLMIFLLVLIKSKWLYIPKLISTANISMWIIFGLFTLNTVGNILAESTFEKLFAIITGLLALLLLRIAIEKTVK